MFEDMIANKPLLEQVSLVKRELQETLTFTPSILEEGKEGGRFIVGGRVQIADQKNGNNRIYPRSLWNKVIASPKIQESLEKRRMLGELDHPSDGKTSLKRASHLITDLRMEPNGEVFGKIEIFDNPDGKRLQEYFIRHIDTGISSRGAGSVKEEERNGEKCEVVQDDYELSTFDFVSDPSCPGAYPQVMTEQKEDSQEDKMPAIEKLRELQTKVGNFRSCLVEGANYDQLSNQLLEMNVEAGTIAADESMRSAVKPLRKQIEKMQDRLKGLRKTDESTMQGLRNKLHASQLVIQELVQRFKKLKESKAPVGITEAEAAEKLVDALFKTLQQNPIESLVPNAGNAAGLKAQLKQAQNEARYYRDRYIAAGKIVEAMTLIGRDRARRMYVENLVKGRNDAKMLAQMVLESSDKSYSGLAKRFRFLSERLSGSNGTRRQREALPEPSERQTSRTLVEQNGNGNGNGFDPDTRREVALVEGMMGKIGGR